MHAATAEERPLGAGGRSVEATAYLRRLRAPARARRRRDTLLLVYGCALVAAVWIVPYLVRVAQEAQTGRLRAAADDVLPGLLPVSAAAVCLLVVVLAAANARWRGPVRLDPPTVDWLLAAPVPRAALLRPRFRAAAARAATLGAVTGGVAGFALTALTPGGGPALVAAGALAGLLTAASGVAAGLMVERYDDVPAVTRGLRRAVRGAVTATCAAVALAAAHGLPAGVVLWSGPWGWAVQPLAAAAGTPGTWWWPAGTGAAVGATALLLARADRAAARVPARALRRRATAGVRVAASLATLDLRQARATVTATAGLRTTAARPRFRIPPPRTAVLVVPWRDLTGLLRAPRHPVAAALWSGVALAASCAAPTPAVAACTLGAGYLAAARLAEPARVEHDDPRRRANLPHPAGRLALAHAVVPAAALLTLLGLGNATLAAAGAWTPLAAQLLLAVPALVGAVLVSACRGPVPTRLLLGTETPFGNTGPMQAALWYVRGPLVALALLVPACAAAPGLVPTLWTAFAGLPLLGYAQRSARRAGA